MLGRGFPPQRACARVPSRRVSLGEPCLYDTTVRLYRGDTLLDTYRLAFGIRQVTLQRTGTTDRRGGGASGFAVNGVRLTRDKERLPHVLPMLTDLRCNMVRCRGGNVYEDDDFYDYGDRHGILVWRNFTRAAPSIRRIRPSAARSPGRCRRS